MKVHVTGLLPRPLCRKMIDSIMSASHVVDLGIYTSASSVSRVSKIKPRMFIWIPFPKQPHGHLCSRRGRKRTYSCRWWTRSQAFIYDRVQYQQLDKDHGRCILTAARSREHLYLLIYGWADDQQYLMHRLRGISHHFCPKCGSIFLCLFRFGKVKICTRLTT
ncbi:hypothetical protein KC326_g223 [Hortaea werneckii]|nr:hypothetical protein KC326_g223 [Hortaea werneckii]